MRRFQRHCRSRATVSFRGVETYLYDVDEDLYGADIRVELLHFIRPERKFESLDALREQMEKDIACGKEFLK